MEITIPKLIIMAIGLSEEKKIECKTRIQKIFYFFVKKMPEFSNIFLYKPHYYGTYSAATDNGIKYLAEQDLIDEHMITMPSEDSPFEKVKYSYSLSDEGNEQFNKIISDESFKKLRKTIEDILKIANGARLEDLAKASKISIILANEQRPMTIQEISAKAKELKWNVYLFNSGDRSIKILEELKLISNR